MERDNNSLISASCSSLSNRIYSVLCCDRRCRSRLERLKVKLRNLKVEQKAICHELKLMQQQEVDDAETLQRYRNELHVLKTHHIDQKIQIVLLQGEVRKLRSLPTEIERSIHFVLEKLNQLEQQQQQR